MSYLRHPCICQKTKTSCNNAYIRKEIRPWFGFMAKFYMLAMQFDKLCITTKSRYMRYVDFSHPQNSKFSVK